MHGFQNNSHKAPQPQNRCVLSSCFNCLSSTSGWWRWSGETVP